MTVEIAAQFSVGEWVFCEFELSLIRRMDDEGRVREITDGSFSHSGFDLTDRCRKLTYEMKQIADAFAYESQRIHREGSRGLNYPDIHRWLVNHWTVTCDHLADTEALKADYKALSDFVNTVLAQQQVDSGYGFPLLRPASNHPQR